MEVFECNLLQFNLLRRRVGSRGKVVIVAPRYFLEHTLLGDFTEAEALLSNQGADSPAVLWVAAESCNILNDQIARHASFFLERSPTKLLLVMWLENHRHLFKNTGKNATGLWFHYTCLHHGRSGNKFKGGFYAMALILNVMGAIDYVHVLLFPPSNKEHIHWNRKNYHSLNIQVVCDAPNVVLCMTPIYYASLSCLSILTETFGDGWLLGLCNVSVN